LQANQRVLELVARAAAPLHAAQDLVDQTRDEPAKPGDLLVRQELAGTRRTSLRRRKAPRTPVSSVLVSV
jgi:hypothetical protein